MKIEDWNSLEKQGIKYIGNNKWRKGNSTLYKKICDNCNENYLGTKVNKTCCRNCTNDLRSKNTMNKLNKILSDNDQKLKIKKYDKTKIIKLSNGLKLTNKVDIHRLYERIHFKNKRYVDIFDEMYNSFESLKQYEKNIRFEISSNAGKKAQELHGERLKKNLMGEPWNKGLKGVQICWNKGLTKETDVRLKKISEDRMGSGNPMWGKKHSEEYKKQASDHIKELILKGEFTPNIHNSNTHWQSKIGNQKYRSSWEAMYHLLNPHCNYETIRIPYKFEGKDRVYIVDFEDTVCKKLIEVKPSSHKDNNKMKAKLKYALDWCKDNDYTFEIVSEEYLFNHFKDVDLTDLDENSKQNLEKMYETYKKKRNY